MRYATSDNVSYVRLGSAFSPDIRCFPVRPHSLITQVCGQDCGPVHGVKRFRHPVLERKPFCRRKADD